MCKYGSQFRHTFNMVAGGTRKRKLDTSYRRSEHRQALYGAFATSAGSQTKSSREQPLILSEMEPGKAVEKMLQVQNPLMTKAEAFSDDLSGYLKEIATNPDKVNSHRLAQLAHWKQRAKDLMATSRAEIMAIKDDDLRNLYLHKKGNKDNSPLFHCALFRKMAQTAGASHIALIDELLQGMYITGEVRK